MFCIEAVYTNSTIFFNQSPFHLLFSLVYPLLFFEHSKFFQWAFGFQIAFYCIIRYDAELATHLTIEADIKKLKAASSDLDMQKRCLETEVQILSNELANLKSDHTEVP